MNEIRLYLFQSGVLKCNINTIKMNHDGCSNYEIPVPFFLLTHPNGHTIIDGGNAVEVSKKPREYWGNVVDVYEPIMSEKEGCVEQIKSLGININDIRYVLLSHLHLDHSGAVGRFPSATHIVQKNEYTYAFTPDWFAKDGYIRNDFDKDNLKWSFLYGYEDDMYDIYGDGILKTVFTPGHTPGHQSFYISLPNQGKFIITSDAVYTKDHWDKKALPGLSCSTSDAVKSVEKLRNLSIKTNAKVIFGHDPELWKTLKHAPEYYS